MPTTFSRHGGNGRTPVHVLVLGGGYVGMYTARRLTRRRRLRVRARGPVRVTLVAPESYMTVQPFLAEAGSGALSPRHVVVPLRRILPRARVVTGHVRKIAHADHRVSVELRDGAMTDIGYDLLVVALGSVSRVLPIPGLAEHGIGFKTVEEAIAVRNNVLEQLDIAASTRDPVLRERALTFVFVGGGFAGVEALGELEDMARYASKYYRPISPADMRWVLVEAGDRILAEVSPALSAYTLRQLTRRGVDVRLSTRLVSATGGHLILSDGSRFDARTLVWTTGVRANPVLADSDLPLDEKGRVRTSPQLAVEGTDSAWSAGDCAAVPDTTGTDGELCAPTAQHALRQARRVAGNVEARLRGRPPRAYRHRSAGSVASLGLFKGVAQVYGIRLRGFPAWLVHRLYHLARVPTLNRKLRILAEWILSLIFKREIISLGSLEDPRGEFEDALEDLPEGFT